MSGAREWAIVTLARPVVWLLAKTWRYEEINDAPWRALRASKRAFIFTLWHGHLLPQAWCRRGEGITVMVSEHRDGELIARLLHHWGCRTVRGSSSKGAGRALLGMVRELQEGHEFAITPDGPRGPAGEPAPGVLMASQRSGAPVVPMRADVSRAWRLRSWDRFVVPKPFARIRVTYGDPWVATGSDAEAREQLKALMGPAVEHLP